MAQDPVHHNTPLLSRQGQDGNPRGLRVVPHPLQTHRSSEQIPGHVFQICVLYLWALFKRCFRPSA